jgi:hypothetical protein
MAERKALELSPEAQAANAAGEAMWGKEHRPAGLTLKNKSGSGRT